MSIEESNEYLEAAAKDQGRYHIFSISPIHSTKKEFNQIAKDVFGILVPCCSIRDNRELKSGIKNYTISGNKDKSKNKQREKFQSG